MDFCCFFYVKFPIAYTFLSGAYELFFLEKRIILINMLNIFKLWVNIDLLYYSSWKSFTAGMGSDRAIRRRTRNERKKSQ